MIIIRDSARSLKRFLSHTDLSEFAEVMVMRMALAFVLHSGRMTCSQAAGSVASETIHRGQLTRFLARARWQKSNFNDPLRKRLLMLESRRGEFVFVVDATLVSQAGQKTENTYSTGNRMRRPRKGRRYGKKKIDTDFSGLTGMVKMMNLMMGLEPQARASKNPKIAVIHATGMIMPGQIGRAHV